MFHQFTLPRRRTRVRLLSGYFTVLAALLLTLLAPSASAQQVTNPYAGAIGFVDPYFAQLVADEATNQSGNPTLQQQMYTVENQSTAVWLTSIISVSDLKGKIDAALSQQASQPSGSLPVVMTIVIYNLPQRDCSALGSSGELTIAGNDTVAAPGGGTQQLSGSGINEYEHDFIDPIYAVLAQYETNMNIRFVLILEPDSIPNMITNAGHVTSGWILADTDGVNSVVGTTAAGSDTTLVAPNCVAANGGVIAEPSNSTVNPNSVYVQGIQYDLTRFYDFLNVFQYLDVGTSAWLGWPSNMTAAVTYYKSLILDGPGSIGYPAVSGFVSNTSNYDPVKEPFLDPVLAPVNGVPTSSSASTALLDAPYYSYNQSIDEEDYDAALYTAFTAAGFPSTIGFLIDTGRNGWGGQGEPTGLITNSNPETEIFNSKIDLRPFRGDWCNLQNAGIGALPAANPLPTTFSHLQAYVWVKPPGESDGTYPTSTSQVGPGYDPNCNPTNILDIGAYQNNLAAVTDSVANSPLGGVFWPSYFDTLVANANIDGSGDGTVTPLPTTPAGITLYASQFALTITQGGTVTDNILASVGGYTGNVNLSAQVIGPSASAISSSFSSPIVQAPGQSTLTLTASQNTTPGHYLVKVSGIFNGNTQATNVSISLTVVAAPGFTLSPSSATLNVTAPASGNSTSTDTITVVPTGGFNGSVTLGYSNAPTGVTASFSPTSTSATSTLTFTVASTVVPGTYSILISGTSGPASSSTPITLLISPATANAKLTASAAALSTTPGGNNVTDTVTVTGFTGSVNLTATGLPSSVTVTYAPNPATSTSLLTFKVSSLATPGTYPVTITGTSGTQTASTIISLTVAPAPVSCHVVYTIETQWPGGFEVNVTIRNQGTATLTNWKLTWTFANGQTITGPWNGNVSQSNANVTVSEQPGQSWENIPAGEGYSGFGFTGTWNNKTNAIPTSFAINGTTCK